MNKSTVYINEVKFTANNETINQVIDSLQMGGFNYVESLGGYYHKDFFGNDDNGNTLK